MEKKNENSGIETVFYGAIGIYMGLVGFVAVFGILYYLILLPLYELVYLPVYIFFKDLIF